MCIRDRRISGQESDFVAAQLLDIGNADLPPFDNDQTLVGELVQDAREVFLRQVKARGNHALIGGQGDSQRIGIALDVVTQQITDDALTTRVQ